MRELKRVRGQRVIITTPGVVLEGRVLRAGWTSVVLGEARDVTDPSTPVQILGVVIVRAARIDYVQVP